MGANKHGENSVPPNYYYTTSFARLDNHRNKNLKFNQSNHSLILLVFGLTQFEN
jgi:hypothetical protein